MRKNNIRMVLFLLIVLSGLGAQAVYAAAQAPVFQQKDASGDKMEAKRKGFYSDLGLSEEQKKLLEENRNKHSQESKAIFGQIKEKTALLRQQLQEDPLNAERVYQTNNELKKLQSEVLDNRVERIMEVRKILTPEQFKKFITKTEKHGESIHGNWQKRKTQ